MNLPEELQMHLDGHCNEKSIVVCGNARFSVLTPCMVRMEWSENGVFEDRPTQVVFNRLFEVPEFDVKRNGSAIEIITGKLHLYYSGKRFSEADLRVELSNGNIWYYGQIEDGTFPDQKNLRGTVRTLDVVNGEIPLGYGLLDRRGCTFFDDSASLTLDGEGWPQPRENAETDVYFLGYGHDYYGAIADFYRLSGNVPMLPRYALGNWWSRYHKYTDASFRELLQKFKEKDIPFSVAVLDMDWHLVDIPKEYGSGWTGYTWNRDFFPDPEGLLKYVHDNGLRITLNVHPANGARAFEEVYPEMAAFMGVDPSSKQAIPFDISDKKFLEAYFKFLHHPDEERGVDFWWIDWQQGTVCPIPGLDPLRALNHFHYLDSARNKDKRGLVLSRFGGLGSQRYPIGFSGDTIITWESLRFQPYFTSCASNIGYTWWSHDIGGHVNGYLDHELEVRWFQFGVLSPINRLHSNRLDKAPWAFPQPYCAIMEDALRFRHRMLPYIYTMNRRVSCDLVPFIVPLYYEWPQMKASYDSRFRNQYMFGSQLMSIPMTSPVKRETMRSTESAWLPPGIWIDFFSGAVYHGNEKGRQMNISRPLEHTGLFAKAGAVVPMDHNWSNNVDNPSELDIRLFAGADGFFDLYEDSGDGFDFKDGAFATTSIKWDWAGQRCLVYASGDLSVLPESRTVRLFVTGVSEGIRVLSSSAEVVSCGYDKKTRTFEVLLAANSPSKDIDVAFADCSLYANEDLVDEISEVLSQMQFEINAKQDIVSAVSSATDMAEAIGDVCCLDIPQSVKDVVIEVLLR